MALTYRENFLRNASLRGHEWIPATVAISGGTWYAEREAAEELCLRHPVLWPGFEKGQIDFESFHREPAQRVSKDAWGCTWQAELDGLTGLVLDSPLDDWDKFEGWTPPTPPEFSEEDRQRLVETRARGELTACGTEHGFLLMRLYYLRGYDNFMMDVGLEDPRLAELVEIVGGYWERVLLPQIEAGVDLVRAADDQGTQTASMLGPAHFRRWLLPMYQRLFRPQRERGGHVFMHTDGYIMDIMDELIESGLTIVNPQDLVNGIDNIAAAVKGRVCVELDIDRQSVLPFGSPADVRELVKEAVMKLGSPVGGLSFIAGIYPPTPVCNIEALCSALEEFRTYWVGK